MIIIDFHIKESISEFANLIRTQVYYYIIPELLLKYKQNR